MEEPFTVASGLEAGLTRKQLRRASLDRSIWGVRRESREAASLDDRCRMLALRMPDTAFFSHITAALLLRAPLSFEHERDSRMHVSVIAPARAPHARDIAGHSLDLTRADVTASRGIAHTTPARTWCDLASQLHLLDLVAVGDYLAHWRTPLATSTNCAEPHASGAVGGAPTSCGVRCRCSVTGQSRGQNPICGLS